MNKYQDALDMISSHLFNEEPHHEFDLIESVKTLQELIDEYLKYEKALERMYVGCIK